MLISNRTGQVDDGVTVGLGCRITCRDDKNVMGTMGGCRGLACVRLDDNVLSHLPGLNAWFEPCERDPTDLEHAHHSRFNEGFPSAITARKLSKKLFQCEYYCSGSPDRIWIQTDRIN